jgi:uncharacterized protein (DUF924 family)
MDPLANPILDFWFGAPGSPEGAKSREVWFRKDPAFDDEIRRRFGDAVDAAIAGDYAHWCGSARGTLALVLLLDQFPRNIHRDTPRAFAGDPRAFAIAENAVARGLDNELAPIERGFIYLPFEHAENAAAQHLSLALFGALARETGDGTTLAWARKHADVVFRFGRYPHRNAILGRASTPEEIAFLAEPGSRF